MRSGGRVARGPHARRSRSGAGREDHASDRRPRDHPARDVRAGHRPPVRVGRGAHIGIVRADVWPAAIFGGAWHPPTWESLDVVRRSARTHRLDVLGLLTGPPHWLVGCPRPVQNWLSCPPAHLAAWARIVEQIVRARAGDPLLGGTQRGGPPRALHRGDPAAYAALLRTTSAGGPARQSAREGRVHRRLLHDRDGLEQVLAQNVTGELRHRQRPLPRRTRQARRHGPEGRRDLQALRVPRTALGHRDRLPERSGLPGRPGFRAGPRSPGGATCATAVPAHAGRGRVVASSSRCATANRAGGSSHPRGSSRWPGLVPKPSYRAVSDLGGRPHPPRRAPRRARTRSSRLRPGTCAPPSRASTTTR